jgi:hypothetical protein
LTTYSFWACEVAATLPNGSVDVVDISDAQFPPPAFQPSNIRFWTHDCFEPFPPEHLGQFDAVNIKFILCIVNDDVADKLIRNVLTLLSEFRVTIIVAECRYGQRISKLTPSRTWWVFAMV